MSTDANQSSDPHADYMNAQLPLDVRESDLDPKVCEECQVLSNRIEDIQDALSDALEWLNEYEVETRSWDFERANKQQRNELLACIERVKRLA